MDSNIEEQSKKRDCKLHEDKQIHGIDSLPREIALDIFSRLSITSVMQSRSVCRSWQNLSLDRNLVSLHLSRVAERDPLLIFHSDFPTRKHLFFAELSGTNDDVKGIVKKIDIPFSASMPEFTVEGSCKGLLCLCDSLYKDSVYIYNPFTNDYKELPKTRQYTEERVVSGFGYYPETNQYKVIKIVYYKISNTGDQPFCRIRTANNLKSEVLVFSSGGSTWRNIGQVPYCVFRSQGAPFIHGRLHWMALGVYNNVRGLIIISFDLADEKFDEVPRPDFSSPFDCTNYELVSLKGCLSAVAYEYGLYKDMEIWLMKEYNVKESWIKVFKIGGKIPESPSTNLQKPSEIWRNHSIRALVTVLCVLSNGEILIEYKVGRLALYNAITGRYKDLNFKGMPSIFETFVHLGSLNQIDLPVKL
ncbi:F-box and associated interaction domains-containing protein [Heracleum sosnowskyi]|uniref:F-box and associated interaction domains-containing protein n=1 Tax=Heracleum sosnowskyi TaxID=360622 RepID=A0AAD8LX23_9APIA|nr:F-box and associated interaction domains-containing protein [Heracleum sosnowskyi]